MPTLALVINGKQIEVEVDWHDRREVLKALTPEQRFRYPSGAIILKVDTRPEDNHGERFTDPD